MLERVSTDIPGEKCHCLFLVLKKGKLKTVKPKSTSLWFVLFKLIQYLIWPRRVLRSTQTPQQQREMRKRRVRASTERGKERLMEGDTDNVAHFISPALTLEGKHPAPSLFHCCGWMKMCWCWKCWCLVWGDCTYRRLL